MIKTKLFVLLMLFGTAIMTLGFSNLTENSSGMPPGYILPFEGTVNITCGPGCGAHHPFKSFDSSESMDFQASDKSKFLLRAVADGTAYVDYVVDKEGKGFGRVVRISHPDGYQSFYAHLSSALVKNGQEGIKQGDPIGYVGNSGTDAIHLHFEIRKGAGGMGKDNVYTGQSIDFSDDSRINYNPNGKDYKKGTATGEPYKADKNEKAGTDTNNREISGRACGIIEKDNEGVSLTFTCFLGHEDVTVHEDFPCGTHTFSELDGMPMGTTQDGEVGSDFPSDFLDYCGTGRYEVTVTGATSGHTETLSFDW